MRKVYNREYSQERITDLADNEVFVFSCGKDGHIGERSGLGEVVKKYCPFNGSKISSWVTEKTYAIPCEELPRNLDDRRTAMEALKGQISQFIHYAKNHPEKKFLVTPIATGGYYKFKTYNIAPLFEEALYVDNIILPLEFVDHLIVRTGKPIVNVAILSSNDEFRSICHETFDTALTRIVKEIQYSSDFDRTFHNYAQKSNIWKSIDAIIYDAEVKESNNDEIYSGLNTVLTVEKALNYISLIPFFCLTTKDVDTVKQNCGLLHKQLENIRIYTKDDLDILKKTISDTDTGDSRLRSEYADLFKAAEWFDSQLGDKESENKETACQFISSVLRDNTDNIVNRSRSFRDSILDFLIKYKVLPQKMGEKTLPYGAIVDFIRDGLYPSDKDWYKFNEYRYYLLETGNTLPRGIRFMFEDIKENGNEASHTIEVLDEFITRSVFYAFCSLLLWLYNNRESINTNTLKCYDIQYSNEVAYWKEFEGKVEIVRINNKDYPYCGNVHLGNKDYIPEQGGKILIRTVSLDNHPKISGVTLFSNDWTYIIAHDEAA